VGGGARGFPSGELVRFGLTRREIAEASSALVKESRLVVIEERLFDAASVLEVERALVAAIDAVSAENKLLWGVDREELKARTRLGEGPLFDFLMEKGRGEGKLFFKGGRVRAGSGERELSPEDEKAVAAVVARVREAGFAFASKADLLVVVRDEKRLTSYLHILIDRGTVVRISPDGFIDAERYRELIEKVKERLRASGTVTVGDFKETFGFSRKYAVPILEHLDREGFTRREGDARKAGPKLG
jgi:selenocysteine-specific elongation factor